MCEISDYADLKLDDWHRHMVEDELNLWHQIYLPVRGTVLDIGAGNGETALFYLKHGATHVICIEPDARLLYQNFGADPRVTIVPWRIDSIKSDCEGGEEFMVVESHRPSKFRKLSVRRPDSVNIQVWKLMPHRIAFWDMFSRRGFWKELRVILAVRTRMRRFKESPLKTSVERESC